jgi:hypothetical protein
MNLNDEKILTSHDRAVLSKYKTAFFV